MIFMSNREMYLLFSEYHHVRVFTLSLGWRFNTLFWLQARCTSRSLTRLPKCSIQVCLHFWISCLFTFHSVEMRTKTRSRYLLKNQQYFRQMNVLQKKLLRSWFHGKLMSVIMFYTTFHRKIINISVKWTFY